MAKKPETFDLTAVARSLGEQLRNHANRPNIYGYVPHEKQKKFHTAQTKGRLYIGGNRSGKTTGGIIEDIMWLRGKHNHRDLPPPPIRGRIVSVDFSYGVEKIIRPELARWIPLSELKGGSWFTAYNKELRTLTLENGSFVELMSYDQDVDKFAGTSRHFVHFDEEPPQEIFDECLARLVDTNGSWWMTMTPVEGMTWIHDILYEPGKKDPNTNVTVIEVDMTENPYLSQAAVEEYIAGLDEETKEARVHGKFVQVGGLIFKRFNLDAHVIEPFEIPKDWAWYKSMDHGYNNPTAWLWHAVNPDGEVFTFSEHYAREMTVAEHAAVVNLRDSQFGKTSEITVGDPAISQRNAVTGQSIADEYAQYGIGIYTEINRDVIYGINQMNTYLRPKGRGNPRWYIFKNCEKLVWEMGRYKWKTYTNKKVASRNNVQDEPQKKNDHAIDSARYFFTLLPPLDLTEISTERPSENILGAVTPVPVVNKFDNYLLKQAEKSTRWQYESVDEHVGMF